MPHPKAVEAKTTSSLRIHIPWLSLDIILVFAWGFDINAPVDGRLRTWQW